MRTEEHLYLNNQQLVLIYSELLEKGCQVQLIDPLNSDLYTLMQDQIVKLSMAFSTLRKRQHNAPNRQIYSTKNV